MVIKRLLLRHCLVMIVYAICMLFMACGAVNYGWTRFVMTLPFIAVAAYVANTMLKCRWLVVVTGCLCALFLLINFTLEHNSLVFPILSDGHALLEKNGYMVSCDGRAPYFSTDNNCGAGEKSSASEVRRGQSFVIRSLHITHPEFGTEIHLDTDAGSFDESDVTEGSVRVDRPVRNTVIDNASWLMAYGLLPVFIAGYFDKMLPGLPVVVVDDRHVSRPAILSRVVCAERDLRPGEKVRLHCPDAQVPESCAIEFTGDREKFYLAPQQIGKGNDKLLRYQ